MIEFLETQLQPRIQWKLKQESAREQFEKLGQRTEAYIRYLVNGLFYLYSDMPNVKLFDFALKEQKLGFQKALQNGLDNRLGELFSSLPELELAIHSTSLDKTNSMLSISPNIF